LKETAWALVEAESVSLRETSPKTTWKWKFLKEIL